MKKQCNTCKKIKNITDFHRHKSCSNGYRPKCKSCVRIYEARRYYKNREKILKYVKAYSRTPAGKTLSIKLNSNMWKKYPKKIKARINLRYAVKMGKIKKQSCVICKSKNVEAHHADYNKPYDVQWLCPLHHRIIEGQQKYEFEPFNFQGNVFA